MVAPHLLQNQNIIAGVLQSLDPGSVLKNGAERGECRRALARLAIVCRATSSPALDVLWKSIGTFKHLLFAFESYNKDRLRFDDDISDEGWLRFQEYASRVRELHMGNKISEVHANVWTTLTRRCLDKPLLPSLERLTGFKLNAMSVCYAMILSPTIKHLSLETDVYSDAGAIDMAAKLLLPILGQLTTLVVDDKYYANNEERQGVSFWTLTNLRALTVTTKAILTIPIIQALAVFPHLRQLTLGIKSVPIVAETPERVEGFDQLRELSLSGSVTDVSAFLIFIMPLHLESLVVTSQRLCDDRQGPPMGQRLEKAFSKLPPSLRRLEISLQCTCNKVHFEEGEKLFQPLRSLHALRRLAFTFYGVVFSLENRLLRALTDAWPNLSALEVEVATHRTDSHFSPGYSRHPAPGSYKCTVTKVVFEDSKVAYDPLDHVPPTIPTIAAFARAHAHLERLVLPSIDLDAVPDITSVPLLGHPLKMLKVCELDADAPLLDFALALDLLFPHLDLADARCAVARGSDARARSDELRLLLLALQTGRTGAYRARAAELARDADAEIVVTRKGMYDSPAARSRMRHNEPGPTTVVILPSPGQY